MLDFKLTQEKPASDELATETYELIILGGGPAGLTAAIYAGRSRIETLLLGGSLPGGQPANTDAVENFPGFPEGIDGPELAQRFLAQAERFGAKVTLDNVTAVDFSAQPFTIHTYSKAYQGRAVIVATGATPRRLGVPGEDTFYGRGVSACATCDGFFYRDKETVVVGGGDSALVEGMFLTKFANKVTIIHRRDELRATQIYQEQAFANPKIEFVWDSVLEEVLGEQTVTGVRVKNVKTGESTIIDTAGVFIYIGMEPQTALYEGQLALNEQRYVISDRRQRTNVPGIFVAGDVQDPRYRQVVVAAGTGAIAAMEAERYLGAYPG
ncbi:MAG TPA: thioredoxin-disulfide reductase [Chloroflexi bacterium]|nr:thioredoxin-disulfide reductase [Chloroflexota bacterium]